MAVSGRVSLAAERLFLSQSALSQALRKLEFTAGTALFDRRGYGVVATDAGRLLVRRARRAAELLSSAERDLRSRRADASPGPDLRQHVTAAQLRALIAVAETGGYSTAARRLQLAQPTIHRAVAGLEELVGVPLFRRAARGVDPTEAAQFLARQASLLFVEIRQGFEEVRELQGNMSGRVTIGCLPLARSVFLPEAVTRLLATYPDADVRILDGPYVELLHGLRTGEIDWLIGALREPAPAADVEESPLFEQSLAVAVRPGHPLLADAPPDATALSRLAWIAPQALAPARSMFTAYFAGNGVPVPEHIIECSSVIAACGLIRRSDRAALLSPMQIRPFVESGQVAILVDSLPNTRRSIGVTVRKAYSPTVVQAAFGDILRQLARESLDG